MREGRSAWESSIETYIRTKYPALRIETNDRSVIPSRNTRSEYFELDIFIPELCLAIEANGETYHDRQQYEDDRAYGTERSDEMYKENYCRDAGIHLMHVWSSESMESIQSRIDNTIERRLADPTIEEWRPPVQRGSRSSSMDLATVLTLIAFAVSGCALIFATIGANREAVRTETTHRQNEAAERLDAEEDEKQAEELQELVDYESQYRKWLSDESDFIEWYNSGQERQALKTYVDEWVQEIQAYPRSDVPDSYASEHSQLLTRALDLRAQLR